MELSEWMSRFAGVDIWQSGKPTTKVLEVYPHFYIDLLAAWERERYTGAREVITEATRRKALRAGILVGHWIQDAETYPAEVVVLSVNDSGTMNSGYRRYWETGRFLVGDELATELLWHTHDGYGEEAGTVEVWAWYTED